MTTVSTGPDIAGQADPIEEYISLLAEPPAGRTVASRRVKVIEGLTFTWVRVRDARDGSTESIYLIASPYGALYEVSALKATWGSASWSISPANARARDAWRGDPRGVKSVDTLAAAAKFLGPRVGPGAKA